MNDIKCPNCSKLFKLDEAGFDDILKQVRDHQFNEELQKQLQHANKEKESDIKLLEANLNSSFQENIMQKNNEMIELKAQNSLNLSEKLAQKDTEISSLKSKIENSVLAKKLEVTEAIKDVEKENINLSNRLDNKEKEKELLRQSLISIHLEELKSKDGIITHLKNEVISIKDMKQKLSTKILGETLEKHCEVEFNKLRSTAFPNAYFEKDNDSSQGTKGDYIYREIDEFENEIISIMFEMKNENDETVNKKKNADFFNKLDKDRIKKGCEYAVLVSQLEQEDEFYNQGIVDVSHKYEKMYVIRPQFFIPIITLLRNAAMNSLEYKAELARVRNQNIDITNFEDKIKSFRQGFTKNYNSAANNFQKAIEEIDKSIARMESVKKALKTTENQYRLANNKVEDLSVKNLTYGNPTMKERFEEISKKPK